MSVGQGKMPPVLETHFGSACGNACRDVPARPDRVCGKPAQALRHGPFIQLAGVPRMGERHPVTGKAFPSDRTRRQHGHAVASFMQARQQSLCQCLLRLPACKSFNGLDAPYYAYGPNPIRPHLPLGSALWSHSMLHAPCKYCAVYAFRLIAR